MKTETVNYYDVKMDSASSLKTFADDRNKYRKRFIEGIQVDEKYNQAALIGNLVDCFLFEPDLFDNKFYMSTCSKVPTDLMMKFVESLYTNTVEMPNSSFEERSKLAHESSGFKIGYDAVIKKFAGTEAEDYFNEILAVRSKGLTVVTTQDMVNAERVISELQSNFVTSHIINLESDSRFTVLNQFEIYDYEVDGHKFKSKMDKVIIDNKDRTVQIYDLKVSWSVENFYTEYYLYRKSYIQAYLYFAAWLQIVKDENSPYFGYEILYPKFIVADSISYMNPLIYELRIEDLRDGYIGFEYKGRWYSGVRDIIIDLKFAISSNIWNISRKNYNSLGVVSLKS